MRVLWLVEEAARAAIHETANNIQNMELRLVDEKENLLLLLESIDGEPDSHSKASSVIRIGDKRPQLVPSPAGRRRFCLPLLVGFCETVDHHCWETDDISS